MMRAIIVVVVVAIFVGAAVACDDELTPIAGVDADAGSGSVEGEGEGEGIVGEGEGDEGEGEGESPGEGGEGEAGTEGEGEAPAPTAVRFVALGDTGEGNEAQHAVADAMEIVCAAQGCDFALLLGDNFYDTGVDGIEDDQWRSKFEEPYADLDFPFYAALGNHDGGFFGAGLQITPGNHQVEYSDVNDKWRMPERYYKHSHANVDMFGIDSSSIFFNGFLGLDTYEDLTRAQEEFLQEQWAGASTGEWRIVYGHHPYLSNGKHGNAGEYEGVDELITIDGTRIKDFMDANVCGHADLYLCGHDHNRQWHVNTCGGTQLIVSGAGSKLTDFEGTQPTHFQDDQQEGFVWFEIVGRTMTIQFWDRDATLQFEDTFEK